MIEPVDGDDRATMDGWFALLVACHAHDEPDLPPPCPVGHVNRFSWPGQTRRAWVVRDRGEIVAVADVALRERDDTGHGFAHVLVSPAHRRRGLGTRLLRHLTADARASGRTRLALGTAAPPDGPAPGAAFLRAAGARFGMVERRRRLDLPVRDPAAWADLTASAAAATRGYRLVQWVGATPERWRDDLAALVARMSTDAPTGELTIGAQRWDAERVRERDTAMLANGMRPVTTAAQAPDGHLVAYTEVSTCVVEDGFAMQGDTLVAPAHRGRRLGLWIKLANLELLRRGRPWVRAVDTFNADENRWMIAVNATMGFVPIQRIEDYELDLTAPDPTGDQAGTTPAISAAASGP